MGAEAPPPTRDLRVVAMNNADELGYLGQQAVAEAVSPDDDYRIVGGHMVRLLLKAYPTSAATPRSTLDADAAVGDVEVIGPDRKSTRLNSSHVAISYAVFCLKKKTQTRPR